MSTNAQATTVDMQLRTLSQAIEHLATALKAHGEAIAWVLAPANVTPEFGGGPKCVSAAPLVQDLEEQEQRVNELALKLEGLTRRVVLA